ncbi:calcium uptake protein, mitochondrial [Trifolium repens]|nr:calcium uptake protein, mitochondrial [Trifolium repens]
MLFDVNSDGMISFKEYIFFVTLLSIPESSFSVAFKMFDVDNNGEITKEEFKKVMALMRSHHRQGVQHRDGLRTGLKGDNQGRIQESDGIDAISSSTRCSTQGWTANWSKGKDGKSSLQLDKFVQFLRDLNDEFCSTQVSTLSLVFCSYVRQDSLSSRCTGSSSPCEFALSMVASADTSHLGKLLERVDELNNDPCFKDVRINFEDFKNFAELRKKLLPLSLALFCLREMIFSEQNHMYGVYLHFYA